MSQRQQFCTFFLGPLFFGLEVERVQEVIRYQQMTRVPLAPKAISGLINLRGQIVAAMDLRERLKMPGREAGQLPMNVVIRTSDGPISLLVDEIGDVLEVTDDTFENPPDTLDAESRQVIRGVHKLKDRLLMILDTEEAIRFAASK